MPAREVKSFLTFGCYSPFLISDFYFLYPLSYFLRYALCAMSYVLCTGSIVTPYQYNTYYRLFQFDLESDLKEIV